jgi:hypothetical protein
MNWSYDYNDADETPDSAGPVTGRPRTRYRVALY